MADVTLSSSIRTNLLSLQNTGDLVNRTNSRLSTGKAVGSAIDDAVKFFQAKSLSDRATDLSERKDGIDQGIQSVKTAMTGLETAEKLMVQMKGLLLSAKSSTGTERTDLETQFNVLAVQLNNLTADSEYQGLNLINATQSVLKVTFSDSSTAYLEVTGVNSKITTFAGFTAGAASQVATVAVTVGNWSAVSDLVSAFDNAITNLDSAITTVRSDAKTLGSNVALLQTRSDFTETYANTLTEGADKLTLADLNEEGANLVALQTRQQLAIQALSFAGQQEQGILSLFR